jgi:GNAT superfamily N-acetyltransferase
MNIGPASITDIFMITIRPARTDDLDACYAISLATGNAGAGAALLYRDPQMMGHIYSAPYIVLEPRLALVVEDDEGVSGFAVGVLDTTVWEERLEREWWLALRSRYDDPSETPPDSWSLDQRRAFMIHHPVPVPDEVKRCYPAHMHMNLLPRMQKRGVGSALCRRWLEVAAGLGARPVHVGVNPLNIGAHAFWTRQGFGELSLPDAQSSRLVFLGVIPDK